MIRLGLIRHGHTAWNRQGRIQGRTDIPLDAAAEAQLRACALPTDWQDADLVASPLQRARRTAELIGGRQPAEENALIEMDWGAWEGLFGRDLRADPASGFRDIEHWGWAYRPPGGESPEAMRERLLPWARGLRRDTLAICHIGVMRVLMAVATGWAFQGPCPFAIKRNRVYIIQVESGNWHLEAEPIRLNEVRA
jgi:probable phosphoglycerate mutase